MKRFGNWQKIQGFTLVELLIAIFIFAIVISSVYGAYRATFSNIGGSKTHLSISRNASVAMERITEDLNFVVTGPGGAFRGESRDITGARGDSMTFISSFHLVLSKTENRTGYAVISFSTERNEETGLLDLYRSDRVLLPGMEKEAGDSQGEILGEGLQEVSFSYLDEEGKESDEWQSESKNPGEKQEEPLFPALVYVKLTFAQPTVGKDGTVFKTAVTLPQRANNNS